VARWVECCLISGNLAVPGLWFIGCLVGVSFPFSSFLIFDIFVSFWVFVVLVCSCLLIRLGLVGILPRVDSDVSELLFVCLGRLTVLSVRLLELIVGLCVGVYLSDFARRELWCGKCLVVYCCRGMGSVMRAWFFGGSRVVGHLAGGLCVLELLRV